MLCPTTLSISVRVLISIILVLILATDTEAQRPAVNGSVQQEITAIPPHSLVEVDLKGGDHVRGRIVSRTASDFSLQREKGAGAQAIAYDQVLSVSQVKGGHSHKTRWIIIGVVAGVFVVAIVFVYKLSHPF